MHEKHWVPGRPLDLLHQLKRLERGQKASGKSKSQSTSKTENRASHTREQVEEVKRFLQVNQNDYYALLGVPRNAEAHRNQESIQKGIIHYILYTSP